MTTSRTKEKSKSDYYRRLKWNIVAFTMIVVCIPLPFVAGTIYKYYWTYVHSSVVSNLKSIAKNRDEAIQVFLTERLSYLKTLSQLMDDVFATPLYVVFYIFSVIFAAIHVKHGLWSAFQTIGADHPKYMPLIRWASWLFSLIVGAGFGSIPLFLIAGA